MTKSGIPPLHNKKLQKGQEPFELSLYKYVKYHLGISEQGLFHVMGVLTHLPLCGTDVYKSQATLPWCKIAHDKTEGDGGVVAVSESFLVW